MTYRNLGWQGVLPVPRGGKGETPAGFTGHDGVDPSTADILQWAELKPHHNLALRMPPDVIGIDVDAYGKKTGGQTLKEAETRWGALPYSPRSTSRGDTDTISGIRYYRVPAGTMFRGGIEFKDLAIGHIDIVQRHHRVGVSWPSIHPEGRQYRWHGIDGGALEYPPAPADLPDLPAAWVDALKRPDVQRNGTELGATAPYDTRQALTEGEPSPRVTERLTQALRDCTGPTGHRFDHTRDHVAALLRFGKDGDTGVLPALHALQARYAAAVGPDRPGGHQDAVDEFHRMVEGDGMARLLAEPSNLEWMWQQPAPPPGGVDHQDHAAVQPAYAARLLTRSDLRALPKPEPLIDNVLDRGTTALLYGKWGTAKTFIALDWATCVATGKPWQQRPVKQGRVLYVVAEGAHGFGGRTDAWETGWRIGISDDNFHVLPMPVNLTDRNDRANLYSLVQWGAYDLVVLDTMARCMVGADENSAKDCGVVIDALTYVLANTRDGRGVVLGVHHAGKDGKTMRGSSAFESGVDTVYLTTRDADSIELTRTKRKDGPETDAHLLKLDPIEGTGSAVIGVSHGLFHGGETNDRAAKLRLIVSQHFVSTGATPTQLQQIAVDDGHMSRSTFFRALNDLVKSGYLVNTGTDKRPHYLVSER